MSAREPHRLLRDDPSVPADLRRAFAAYGEIAPAASTRDALFARIDRGVLEGVPDPGALNPPAKRKTLRLVVSLLGLSILGALGWRIGNAELDGPPATLGAPVDAHAPGLSLHSPSGGVSGAASASDTLQERPIVLPPVQPAPVEGVAPRARLRAAPAANAGFTKAAEPVDPAEELALLTRAKRVLPSDPQAALNLTREHTARFPRGVFREEREVLAIEALARGGQRGRAMSRANAFRQAYPRSTHLDRLAVVLREP
jgi:hypothetical protein